MTFGTQTPEERFKIGNRLQECRKRKGLTREQLSNAVSQLVDDDKKAISVKQIGYIENGTRQMSAKYLLLLSEALGVRKEYLSLEDDWMTDRDLVDAFSGGRKTCRDLIVQLMEMHGYTIVADTFKWEPSEIDPETGKEGKLVHYGIKSKDGCMYIGHDEIERIIREIDAFIDFKCSFSLNSPKAQTERSFVVAESYTKGVSDNG